MGPDHGTGRGGYWEQPSTPCRLIDAPQVPLRLRCDSSWLDRVGKKPTLKADLAIYSYIVTVSGQYLSVAIIKWISIIVTKRLVFTNPVTNPNLNIQDTAID